MSSLSKGRNLTVLIIDDQISERLKETDPIFDNLNIKIVTSWAKSQYLIQTEGDMGGADVLLIDVSFDTDNDILKAKDTGLGFLPIGPILALPYIGKRTIMSCIIYSGHILNQDLHKHPYFLIPMGLILSRTERDWTKGKRTLHSKYLSFDDKKVEYLLDGLVENLAREGASNTIEALKKGLDSYRDQLFLSLKNKNILFTNRAEVLSKISELQVCISQNEDVLIEDKQIKLEISSLKWKDRILLASVFADRIQELGRWEAKKILEEISEWLEEIGVASPIEQAIEMIKIQDEQEDLSNHRPKITDVILKHLHPDTSNEDFDEILRLCVLFANSWAIDNPKAKGNVTAESVYKRLGDNVDQNIYLGWFGERGKQENIQKNIFKNSGRFKRLQYLNLATDATPKEKCFLIKNTSQIEIQEKDYNAIERYRAEAEFQIWETPPFKIIPNTKTITIA